MEVAVDDVESWEEEIESVDGVFPVAIVETVVAVEAVFVAAVLDSVVGTEVADDDMLVPAKLACVVGIEAPDENELVPEEAFVDDADNKEEEGGRLGDNVPETSTSLDSSIRGMATSTYCWMRIPLLKSGRSRIVNC